VSSLDLAALGRAAAARQLLGKKHELHAELASTNDRARELAVAGAPEGTLVIALRQTGGRGRLGRAWVSPPGGLYLSLVLRPDDAMMKRAPISLVGGLAASEALDAAARVATTLKWPNDVLLDGKKVGGILADLSTVAGKHVLILGVGLNVDTPLEALPAELRGQATSLLVAKGKPIGLEAVLTHFLSHLEGHYDTVRKGGGPLILSRAADRMTMLGQRVRVKLPERTIEGTASGLNATGALVVATDDGKREIVYAGEVEEVRPA
jgi:BirA family biotin operon repressor/biotin-[acetyl-CoA-carboxylase] ligase